METHKFTLALNLQIVIHLEFYLWFVVKFPVWRRDPARRTSTYLSVLPVGLSVPSVPAESCHQVVTTGLQTQHSVIPSINKWRRHERERRWMKSVASRLSPCSLSGRHYLDHRAHTPCGAHTHRTHTPQTSVHRHTFTYTAVVEGKQSIHTT